MGSAPIPTAFVIPASGHNDPLAALAADGHTLYKGRPSRAVSPVPGSQIRHALQLDIDGANLFRGSAGTCFRWPATRCDSYGPQRDGGRAPALRMGALLALPSSLNLGSLSLQTTPGRMIAWTLQNFGGYVANDTASSTYSIVTELGPDGDAAAQFEATWGFPFTSQLNDTPWSRDIATIVAHLAVVNNNAPSYIGGGGAALQSRTLSVQAASLALATSLLPADSAIETSSRYLAEA